jgi:hypothetical protein
MQNPDDEGVTHIQRLKADEFDIVLGASPPKRALKPAPRSRNYAPLIACLAVLGLVGYMYASRVHPPAAAVPEVTAAGLPAQETAPADMDDSPAPQPPATPAYVLPPVTTTPAQPQNVAAVRPQPLSNCLKDGTTMDDNVAKCRFGEMPKPEVAPGAQGMVSARYMAQYKAEQARPVRNSQVAYSIATVEIREWKGRNRYRAQWHIVDNQIDNDSVCGNFPSSSVEHRECRRAAEVYFKEACQEWSKRADNEGDEQTKATQARYCQANKSFVAAD